MIVVKWPHLRIGARWQFERNAEGKAAVVCHPNGNSTYAVAAYPKSNINSVNNSAARPFHSEIVGHAMHFALRRLPVANKR